MKQNLKIRVKSPEENVRIQRAFMKLGFYLNMIASDYDSNGLMKSEGVFGYMTHYSKEVDSKSLNFCSFESTFTQYEANEITLQELESLAVEYERESKMKPNGIEFAKVIGQLDITYEQATEQPITVSQAVYEIGQVLERCDPINYKAIFAKMFELADTNFVRTIREALANFEGTQAAKPQSNATQVEYIDDYLDRLRGEETDFYK